MKELEEKVKALIAASEQRVAFTIKSTTAQLKKENIAQAGGAEKKAGPLDVVKKNVTPTTVLFFLIFWMLWSINSNLSALQQANK